MKDLAPSPSNSQYSDNSSSSSSIRTSDYFSKSDYEATNNKKSAMIGVSNIDTIVSSGDESEKEL